MAKRRRHYRGITDMSLGDLKSAFTGSVKSSDVLLGAVAGLAGVAAGKWALTKAETYLATQNIAVPAFVNDLAPALGATAAGIALYAAQKGNARGTGHLIGATAGGLAITAGGLAAKYSLPGFSGVVSVNLRGVISPQFPMNRSSMGLVAANRRNLALVASNPRAATGLIAANANPLTRTSSSR